MRAYMVGAAAAVAALAGLYLAGQYSGALSGESKRVAQSGVARSAAATGATPGAGAANADPNDPAFAYRRLEIDTSKPQAEACLVFTAPLDQSGKTRYEDYLSIEPAAKIAVRANDARLCIAGLSFSHYYAVTLKSGLPSIRAGKLAASETVQVELRDRPPLIRFEGGILLPRENAEGVPIATINIAKLRLRLIRVGDRLLSQLQSGLIDETKLYAYNRFYLEDQSGSVVWTGEMDVKLAKNEAVTTLVPLREMLKTKEAGAYLILASDAAEGAVKNEFAAQFAAQWVIDSDIGLTSFMAGPGQPRNANFFSFFGERTKRKVPNGAALSVFARSFSDARPLSGIRLALISRNNNVLQETKTDASGRADFDAGHFRTVSGGDEPVEVMAYGKDGDFTFIDLRRPAFDLTDRGVGGRAAPGPVDAFLYTERGVYRPGERVEAVAMLRDAIGHAISAPLTLVAQRPDGVEFRRVTARAAELSAGGWHWTLGLTPTAPQGRWQISAYLDPEAEPVGRIDFDVADFVPQRLKLTLTPQQKFLVPRGDFHIKVESRFLYGAPAADLTGEGEARLMKDTDPFPAYPGYRWGRDDEKFKDVLIPLSIPVTGKDGTTDASGNLGELPDSSLPLKAEFKIGVDEPGGRTTTDTVTLPVHNSEIRLGLRPKFPGDWSKEDARASFEAIAVDADGKRIARKGLRYEFQHETIYYSWFESQGNWTYDPATRSRIISAGTLDIEAGAPSELGETLRWGRYRLTISDPETGASTSIGFGAGWLGASASDRPDRVTIAADKAKYRPGETAHIKIAPESNGRSLIVVAGEKLHSSKEVDVSAAGAEVDIPVSADWGAGAYVLVTHYRPLKDVTGHTPVRSVGVIWLSVDNSARTLTVDLGGPQKIVPRQNITIPIAIRGLSAGEEAYVTLAAVDEGILQLTDYKSPDPAGYYFGKRRMGLFMRDDYGRLILAVKAPMGEIRSGGDGFGGRPLAVVPTRTVALFSGPVKLKDGKASIDFNVPDFEGELRLVAVAFSKDKVGGGARPLTVRDPVVADIVLPRFLAPGDTSQASVNLHNVEGPPGAYTLSVRATGAATVPGVAAVTTITRDLQTGARELAAIPLKGVEPGIATIDLTLTGPNGFKVARDWQIEIRPAQLPVTRTETALIQPGQSWTANPTLMAGLVPATSHVALTISATRSFTDIVGMLHWLHEYPFGCLEQVTSRAMPLLVFNDLAPQARLPKDALLRLEVQYAVDEVLDKQNANGAFGLWGPANVSEPWLTAYALDFLYQARSKNYEVPEEALRRGAAMLQEIAASEKNDEPTRAYAFYVLAREGRANLSDLRYFTDVKSEAMTSAMGSALLGAALAHSGDKARANLAFEQARKSIVSAVPSRYSPGDYYGTLLRDVAGATALAAEGGAPEVLPALLQQSDTLDMSLTHTTTQEKAWMLRAAYEISKERVPLRVEVDGKAQEPNGAVRIAPTPEELQRGIRIVNQGQAAIWRTVSTEGASSTPLPAESQGLSLKKSVWTLAGKPADLANLKQSDRVIVLLEGEMSGNLYREMAAVDLLPAGLEIETTLSGDEGNIYPFLGALTKTNVAEARDDRYAAAFNVGWDFRARGVYRFGQVELLRTFRLAYVARAVAPGNFTMPAATVEDMYAPSVHARTAMGTMAVSAAR